MGGDMTATQVLEELKDRHVELVVVGDRLRFRPAQAVPEELKEAMRAHKAELMEVLKARDAVAVADALHDGVSESPPSLLASEVVAMSLEAFSGAGLVVTVHSERLGEKVVFASDNAVVDPGEQRVVYRAAELRQLHDLEPGDLSQVHRAKKTFRGTVEAS